jgi:uncharacterized protein (TIGR00661 family)
MNILYGLCGEGMGHTTRSKVVIDHLRSQNHRVLVAASGRSAAVLKKHYPNDVLEIEGFFLEYQDGSVDSRMTAIANAMRMNSLLARQADAFRTVDGFAPEAVVTDFEQFATFYASTRSLPLVAIGNHGVFTRCVHDPAIVGNACTPGVRAYIWLMEPGSAQAIVSTIVDLPVKPEYPTVLVPPILRQPVIDAKVTDGEHVLVYQTSASDSRLIDALNASGGAKFKVYGLNRDKQIGNCTLCKFSEDGFLRDLASARAVIANGGYSLTSEAVALGKPLYSIPVRNHFEQLINARYVRALGFGDTAEFIQPAGVAQFLERVPEYTATLRAKPRHDANKKLYGTLDRFFASAESAW